MTTTGMSPDRLAQRIASIQHLYAAGDASIGGMDADTAEDTMAAIIAHHTDGTLPDITEDDALDAYDICHAIATFGRAF